MILYLIIMFISIVLIITLGYFFFPSTMNIWLIILDVLILSVLAIAISGLLAYLSRKLPEKYFRKEKGFFFPSKNELKFLKFIKIHKWKDKVLEIGKIGTGVSKSHIDEKDNADFIMRFIMESNYGQFCHIVSLFVVYLIVLISPFCSIKDNLFYSLSVSAVAFILNLLPIFVLRYNNPRLLVLKKRVLSKQK